MSEYKHTPGEWKRDRRASMNIVSSNGRGVASCGQVRDSTAPDNGDAENMANSQLILAAPDMLEELERLGRFCRSFYEDGMRPDEWLLKELAENAERIVAHATRATDE